MNKFIKQHCLHKIAVQSRLLFLIFISLFTLPATTWAAENLEKIFIDADYMRMNIVSGKSVYTGNVKISQGELVLTGDKVTLERKNEEVERITVIGKPARYNMSLKPVKALKPKVNICFMLPAKTSW